jgi:NADH-quinone oxidoreductase subunit E
MMHDADPACRRNCRLTAALSGVAVAAFLVFISHAGVLAALILGGLVAFGLGGFLRWAFCSGRIAYVVPAPLAPVAPFTPFKLVSTPVPSAGVEPGPAMQAPEITAPPAATSVAAAKDAAPAAPPRAPVVAAPAEAEPPRPLGPGPFAPLDAVVDEPAAPARRRAPAKAKAGEGKIKVSAAAPEKTGVAPKTRASKARADTAPAGAVSVATAPAPVRSRSVGKAKTADRRTEPKPSAALPPRASGLDFAVSRSKTAVPAAAAPEMLSAPRAGKPDDLKEIRGIGPVIEAMLNQLGFWHFDQIAGWKARDIAYVDERLVGFHGRISRDEWVRQAQALAAGGTTDEPRKAARRKGGSV